MPYRISHLCASLSVALMLGLAVEAQTTSPVDCPSLSIDGVGISPSKGSRFSYSLKGLETYSAKDLSILWTLQTYPFDSATVKLEGQGTLNPWFVMPDTYRHGTITMTATVSGIPVHCENRVSESVHWDGPPDAVKIGEMANTSPPDLDLIKRFGDELANNPSNQGYVYIAYKPITPTDQVTARERAIVEAFARERVGHDMRITLVRMTSSRDVTEFWRVPPGATNPMCEACEHPAKTCPSIGIEHRADVVKAGDQLEFRVKDRDRVGGLSFDWTVKNGKIESGQGTSTIRVRPVTYYTRPVEAAVKVRGLPKGCNNTFEESYAVPCHRYLATSIDVSFWSEYRAMPWTGERKELESVFVRGLRWQPEKIAYIEKGFPSNTTARSRGAAINRIRSYVLKTLKIPRDKLFIRSRMGRSATRIYLVPADAPVLDPTWKESCVQE